MKLEQICKLINEAGQSRAIITIDTNGTDAVILVNVPTSGSGFPDLSNTKEMALRKALSTPLRVIGKVVDVDAMLDEQVAIFGEGFTPASNALGSPLSNATATKESQLNSVKKNKTTTAKKAAPKAKSAPERTTDELGQEEKTPVVEKTAIDISDDVNFDMFASNSAL